MRALTHREKRTVRLAAAFLALYLAVFYGFKAWKFLEGKRAAYQGLRLSAEELKLEILRERAKGERLRKLRESFRIDLAALRRETLVGEANVAIQKAAQACGLGLGPSRESPGRTASRELSSIQIEGVGPTPAAALFLQSLGSLGVPLVVDGIHVKTGGMQPGQIHLSVRLSVLDPGASKTEVKSGV